MVSAEHKSRSNGTGYIEPHACPAAGGEAQKGTMVDNLRNNAIMHGFHRRIAISVLAYLPLPPLAREAIGLCWCIACCQLARVKFFSRPIIRIPASIVQ